MKNRVIITKGNNQLSFYLVSSTGTFYLFTQEFSKGVYEFFRCGRSEREIKSFSRWNRNKRLDKTVEKIPMYISYIERNVA